MCDENGEGAVTHGRQEGRMRCQRNCKVLRIPLCEGRHTTSSCFPGDPSIAGGRGNPPGLVSALGRCDSHRAHASGQAQCGCLGDSQVPHTPRRRAAAPERHLHMLVSLLSPAALVHTYGWASEWARTARYYPLQVPGNTDERGFGHPWPVDLRTEVWSGWSRSEGEGAAYDLPAPLH